MAPREVFTLATPAHQNKDSKGFPQSPAPLQDTQTLFASPSQALSASQLYTPHLPGSSPLNTSEVHREVTQSLPMFNAHSVDGSSTMQTLPPYSSPTSETMQQNQLYPEYDAYVAPPAPASSNQQPQPYSQPQPSTPAHVMPPQPQQNIQNIPMQTPRGYAVQTTQPRPAPGMDIRNMKGIPRDGNGVREWSYGCSECFDDCGTCMLGWCCPCMVYSQVQTRLNHLETRGAPHPTGGDSCASDCLIHGLLTACCGLGWVLQIGQRTVVRSRYLIAGDGCGDCMMAYCCTPCELTQVSRELELEERALVGAAPIQPLPMQQQTQQLPVENDLPNPYPPNQYPEKR